MTNYMYDNLYGLVAGMKRAVAHMKNSRGKSWNIGKYFLSLGVY